MAELAGNIVEPHCGRPLAANVSPRLVPAAEPDGCPDLIMGALRGAARAHTPRRRAGSEDIYRQIGTRYENSVGRIDLAPTGDTGDGLSRSCDWSALPGKVKAEVETMCGSPSLKHRVGDYDGWVYTDLTIFFDRSGHAIKLIPVYKMR
jgi:hypothetical protein